MEKKQYISKSEPTNKFSKVKILKISKEIEKLYKENNIIKNKDSWIGFDNNSFFEYPPSAPIGISEHSPKISISSFIRVI